MRNLYCDKDDCIHNYSVKCQFPIEKTLQLSHDCCGLLKCEEYKQVGSLLDKDKDEYLKEILKLEEEQEIIDIAMCKRMLKDKI